jgi:hypothetical protein
MASDRLDKDGYRWMPAPIALNVLVGRLVDGTAVRGKMAAVTQSSGPKDHFVGTVVLLPDKNVKIRDESLPDAQMLACITADTRTHTQTIRETTCSYERDGMRDNRSR